jgi:hypothetical protein
MTDHAWLFTSSIRPFRTITGSIIEEEDGLGVAVTDEVIKKVWISNEAPPEQLRWKISFWDGTTYLECEGDSLRDVSRLMLIALEKKEKS